MSERRSFGAPRSPLIVGLVVGVISSVGILLSIITIALYANICGTETWNDIVGFGEAKVDWLNSFLDRPNGIHAHDTFNRFFAALNPMQFQSYFVTWMQAVSTSLPTHAVALDVKTVRGSHDRAKGKAAIHTVSARAAANPLVLTRAALPFLAPGRTEPIAIGSAKSPCIGRLLEARSGGATVSRSPALSRSKPSSVAWSGVLDNRHVRRLDRRALLTVLAAWCVGCSPPLHGLSRHDEPVPTAAIATPPRSTSKPRPMSALAAPVNPQIAVPAPIPTTASPSTATAIPPPTATAPPMAIAASTPEQFPTQVADVPTATVAPTPGGQVARIIVRGLTSEKLVALTYDAGADRGQASQLLAYLDQVGVKVTFGMTGRWAEINPDLVRNIAASGHELMNHTYDHRSFTGFSAKPAVTTLQGRLIEIQQAETIIQEISGVSPRPLFRPPYGDEDNSVLQAVGAAGYQYSVLWTVDSTGWRGIPTQQIVNRCLRLAVPGAIYAMHVGALSHDIDATPSIVEGLRAQGYGFTTVGVMLGLASPIPIPLAHLSTIGDLVGHG